MTNLLKTISLVGVMFLSFLSVFSNMEGFTASPNLIYPQTDKFPFQEQPGEPVFKQYHLGQFGPEGCTLYGDPFSPLGSPYDPDLHTYQYEILIPPDYESQSGSSIIRVELLDPDSINGSSQQAVITHTQRWLEINPTEPLTQTAQCTKGTHHPCEIHTCEWDRAQGDWSNSDDICFLASSTSISNAAEINPFWVLRMDEIRGDNPGNGFCREFVGNLTEYGTTTLYELYYVHENKERVSLARYTAQSGYKEAGYPNSDYDNYDHGTDLRWVSPGAFNEFGEVPTDCGSSTGGYVVSHDLDRCPNPSPEAQTGPGRGFEIDLAQDTFNLPIDSLGFRSLYLDVTTLGGSSENSFGIWAGPPEAVANLPTDINLRHVALANARHMGEVMDNSVRILAVDALYIDAMTYVTITLPLQFITEYDIVQSYDFSVFDLDAWARPPLFLYHDQIDRNQFQFELNPSAADSCFGTDFGCNNLWLGENEYTTVDDVGGDFPPLNLPEGTPNGRLMMEVQVGLMDSFVILVDKHPLHSLLLPLAARSP